MPTRELCIQVEDEIEKLSKGTGIKSVAIFGGVSYEPQLKALKEGVHKLKVRAWDIVNNMGENEIEFEVVNNEEIQLQHVLNYPNPFTTSTSFFFEHNQPNVILDINITIFTIGGKVVKCINDQQTNAGFRSNAIQWDGRDDYGNKIGKGVYIYRLRVRKEDGSSAEKIEKIVIL